MRGKLRTSISIISLVTLLSVGPGARTASPAASAPAQVTVSGSGGQTSLRHAGKAGPVNLLSFTLHSRAIYDDNGFSTNQPRLGDKVFSFSPNRALSNGSNPRRSRLDYAPSSLAFPQFDQYNGLNHGLDLRSSYGLGAHSRLSLRDTLGYQLDGFEPLAGERIVSGPRLPTGFDRTGLTPAPRRGAVPTELDATHSRADEFTFANTADQKGRNAKRDKVLLIALCLAVHGAVTWDAQTTNHFFRHHPDGFRPAEADPLLRPFAGKALMYPMANLFFAAPVDLLLFKTRHDPMRIRLLVRAAAIAWAGLEVQQAIVNMRNEHIRLAPATGPARISAKTP